VSGAQLVAIHQPNFFPWLGYFDKLARADCFVLLDDVQFPKTGGSWINRVQVVVQGRASWLTMPVVRAYHGVRTVGEMLINEHTPWRTKLLRTLEISYGRAPFFSEVFPRLEALVNNPAVGVADYNVSALRSLAEAVRLDPGRFVLASALDVTGQASDRLVAIVRAVGGAAYLYGRGARDYQENEKFGAAGIELVEQGFQHPRYGQCNTPAFIPGLSIIDAMMNCGCDGAARLLEAVPRDRSGPGSQLP
jgi:hypothetical protein